LTKAQQKKTNNYVFHNAVFGLVKLYILSTVRHT
jgi:hypothetical protein